MYYIWSTECTIYEALNILYMKHWIDCIWSTEYTIYEALDILHIKHWVYHIWSIECITYKALNILYIALRKKEQWDWFYNLKIYH